MADDLFHVPPTRSLAESAQIVIDRAPALEELIARAYRDPTGEAWKTYQTGLFRLNTKYPGPWQEDWATHGLRTVAREIQDRHLPYETIPAEAKERDAFVDHVCALLPSITTLQTPLLRFLLTGSPTRDQWRIYAASMYGRGRVHHGNLARLSFNLRDPEICFAYRMVGDEGGQGNAEKSHHSLILPFLAHLGGSVADTDKIGELLESQVLYNWMMHCFMHPNPIWSVATIFYLENQAAMEFTAMLPRLRQVKMPEEVLEFFVIHGDDPETELHNNMCREMLRNYLTGPEDIRIALTAIRRAGQLFESAFARVAALMGIPTS